MNKDMFYGKKVIIFDMDGTLIDSVGIWNKTDEILIGKLINKKVEIPNIQQIRDKILAECKSDDIYLEYCDFLRKKYNSNMTAKEILDLRWNISNEYIKNKVKYKPDADKLLHTLKNKGYTLALATTTTNIQLNEYRNFNKNIIEKANIDDIFEIILSKEDVKEKKPSPEVHNNIMKLLNVKPSECLIVEDSLIGVQAAKNAGIEVAVMYDKYSDIDREEINRLADYTFNTFEEILDCINVDNNKIENLLQFYLLATELKDKIRSGWKIWNINRKRVESVAEHIYGTCILAIAIDSEFDFNIDLQKVIMMLVLHEIEEVKIGDLTPFDKVTKEEKRKIGKQAVEEILDTLNKKVQYINLIEEFENMETKESVFAKMCDKLEADIQCKIYCEENSINIDNKENENLLKDERVRKLLEYGEKTVADLYIENDRPIYTEEVFKQIVDFIKKTDLLKLK